jgi:hypothetical protein
MDMHCWIANWIGVLVGVVITRIWMALDLDAKLPWMRGR